MSRTYTFLATQTYLSIGGMQKFNRRLISALSGRLGDNAATDLRVALRTDESKHLPVNVKARFFPSGRSLARFVLDCLRASFGGDVIIAGHVNLLPIAFLCKIVAPRAKVALIVHGDDVWGDPIYRAERLCDRFLMRRLDRIISVSAYTARRMQVAFGLGEDPFRIFMNAVDPIEFSGAEKRHSHEILTVTRLASHDHGKNIDKVLKALARLVIRIPNIHYTIIGDGLLRPELELLTKELGIEEYVTFAGRVDDIALADAYDKASIFVMPSEKEGFGIVFLEAWQRELPVICGTSDAACEIISDGIDGFAVDPHDIESLQARLEWLLSNPAVARAMGLRGSDKVRVRYLDDAYRKRLSEILDEIEHADT